MNKYKFQNLWNEEPKEGDLVEIGFDSKTGKPFIGVVTKVDQSSLGTSFVGEVFCNGTAQWCDLYQLKPLEKNWHSFENA